MFQTCWKITGDKAVESKQINGFCQICKETETNFQNVFGCTQRQSFENGFNGAHV